MGGTRSPAGLAEVSAAGVTWASNHSGNEISTSGGAARTGAWGMYSNPHGDQTVPGALDPITDGFVGTSSETLMAVGGWVRGTAGGKVAVILDGDVAQRIELGPVDAQFRFYGVIDRAGFHSFEFRELEGTLQDQKLIFVDDVTMGRAPVAGNDPPSGTIVEPGGDVTVPVGQPVIFRATATDPDGDGVTVLWDFGDGATSAALEPGSHVYQAAGDYAVTLTATDARGLSDPSPATRTIRVLDQWPRTDGVVAGVAAVRGLRGSDWHTDLWLHNGSQSPAQVELYYAGAGAPLSAPVVRSLAADSTSALPDVVGGTFGRSGSGAVFWRVVAGDPAAVLVTANTYNRLDDVRRYGQEVPGVTWSGAAPAGEGVVAPALAGPFRSNLGFATDEACTQVVVRGWDRSGALQVERTLDVAPLSWVQLDSLFRRAFPALLGDPDGATAADSLHTFEVTGVGGKVVAYTSIVDNSSNDGSYMLARRWESAMGTVWLPGAALTSGFGASRWRSDVMAVAPVAGAAADLAFYPSGQDNGAGGQRRQLALAAGEASLTSNVLSSLFGARPPAVGSLTGEGGSLLWMRTYTEESNQDGAFTYGQAIPAFAPEDAVAPGEEGRAFGFTADARTRSNLILQNVLTDGGGALLGVGIRVDLIDGQGVVLHQHGYQLRPGEYLQHNSFMADYGIGEISTGALRVVLTDVPASAAGGGVVAMVSEVNGAELQGTNDGRLIPAMIPGRPRAQ